jgi:hypothetical protein
MSLLFNALRSICPAHAVENTLQVNEYAGAQQLLNEMDRLARA